MSEVSLEEVISEKAFAKLVQARSGMYFRLVRTLGTKAPDGWGRRHFFQLTIEADDFESFLDDYGARYNRTFHFVRELVASVRGFAMAGFSIVHLMHRLRSYRAELSMPAGEFEQSFEAIRTARATIVETLRTLMTATLEEARTLDLELDDGEFPDELYVSEDVSRKSLPRNVGQEDLEDEEQKIAEVCSKYLQACDSLGALGVRRLHDPAERERFLNEVCNEERARVLEASVHNLQSAYDTYIKNSVIEARDDRLPRLRGHVSAALHFLEAVTQLTHFVERHERDNRQGRGELRIDTLVDRTQVRDLTLNGLLYWANRYMQGGRTLAEDLLPSYTNVQELAVVIADDLVVHARPAALIVAIVNRYGTPVELEIEGAVCNAGSILELMVAVGSHPDAKRFVFRGDEHPLQDIRILFESRLGEDGLDALPAALGYLRS